MDTSRAFEPELLKAALETDAEFRIRSRFCTARIRVIAEQHVLNIRLTDGQVTSINDVDTGFDSYDVLLAAPLEVWSELFRPTPRPFFQDIWAARFHHGFQVEGDVDLYSAYLGALQRLAGLMRELVISA